MQNVLEYLIFLIFVSLLRILPLFIVRRFAIIISFLLFFVFRFRRKITSDNLRNAYPEKPPKELSKIGYGSYKSFFISTFELFWMKNLSEKRILEIVKFDNLTVFEKLFNEKKGVMLMTGHIGNWEFLGNALGITFSIKFPAIAKRLRNPYVNGYLEKSRNRFGLYPLYMDTGIKEIFRTIFSGGLFAVLADQSAPQESYYIKYFSRPAATFKGPALFALKSKAKVVFSVCIRQPDFNYKVYFEEIPIEDISEVNEKNMYLFTKRHVEILEKYVRKYPDQWLWSHRRWKHADKYEKFGVEFEKSIQVKNI